MRSFAAALALVVSASLAACQTGGPVGGSETGTQPIRESELRAYCPPITLREGTASFRTYDGSAQDDPERVVYQASISDTSRTCNYGEGTITAAVAGRVVPGPRGRTGTITMPIRVVALRGDEVVYSRLFQHSAAIEDTAGATQFLFTDPGVVIPGGIDRGIRLTIGFDEGTGRQ